MLRFFAFILIDWKELRNHTFVDGTIGQTVGTHATSRGPQGLQAANPKGWKNLNCRDGEWDFASLTRPLYGKQWIFLKFSLVGLG